MQHWRSLVLVVLAVPHLTGCGSGANVAKPTEEAIRQGRGEGPDRQVRSARLATQPLFRDWGMKETVVDALARIGEQAAPPLIEALADRSLEVRVQAARALGRLGPKAKAAAPALIRALDDRHEVVRLAAARALGQIGPDAADAIPALIDALRAGTAPD